MYRLMLTVNRKGEWRWLIWNPLAQEVVSEQGGFLNRDDAKRSGKRSLADWLSRRLIEQEALAEHLGYLVQCLDG